MISATIGIVSHGQSLVRDPRLQSILTQIASPFSIATRLCGIFIPQARITILLVVAE